MNEGLACGDVRAPIHYAVDDVYAASMVHSPLPFKALPAERSKLRPTSMGPLPVKQGLTLVHFSAQPKPFWSHLPVSTLSNRPGKNDAPNVSNKMCLR